MSEQLLLDTNAYFLLYKEPRDQAYHNLVDNISHDGRIEFFLPAIAALEIYSVIGKAKRGTQKQIQKCERNDHPPDTGVCPHYWWTPRVKGIPDRLYAAMHKMVKDVHEKRGPVQADIVPLSLEVINISILLLKRYSDRLNFRSQDSLVAATAVYLNEVKEKSVSVATSDRVLKNVLSNEGIRAFDPLKNQWTLAEPTGSGR